MHSFDFPRLLSDARSGSLFMLCGKRVASSGYAEGGGRLHRDAEVFARNH
jgi:hypothetical protein